MMKKKTKVIIIVAIIISVIVTAGALLCFFKYLHEMSDVLSITEFFMALLYAAGVILVYFIYFLSDITAENPPEPVIAYAEFPYEIVCEFNDELYTSNGDYICEYKGVDEEREAIWNSYVKGTSDDEVILFENEKIIVYCTIGEPEYYMGAPEFDEEPEPELYCEILPEGYIVSERENPESFEKVCGAEIVSYDLSDPIENTFVSKKWYEFWK